MKKILSIAIFLSVAVAMMAQGQGTFVVSDKKGNNNLVQGVTFQHDKKGSSWTGDGLSGSIGDLQYIARTRTELATASGEDVTRMLEQLSGTGQADAEAVAVSLKNNPNVEVAYSEDGDNLIVKNKGNEGDVVYPMYEIKSPFKNLYVPEPPNNSKFKKTPRKAPKQYPKVAIFNFFEDMEQYKAQNIITRRVEYYFSIYGYDVNYYTPKNTKEELKFTYKNLESVINNSENYAAIIIMTHGARDEGRLCFCTGELAKDEDKALFNPADGKNYKRYWNNLQAASNCILYLGICDGVAQNNFGSLSPTIGYSGPTCMAQANAAILFYLMLEEGYTLEKALSALYPEPAPNQSTKIYKSGNVGGQTLESDDSYLNRDYLRGYSVDYSVNSKYEFTVVSGRISGYEGSMPRLVSMEFFPILGYEPKDIEYYWGLKENTCVIEGTFDNAFKFENLPENIYICRIYKYNGERDGQLIEPKLYRFRICSENFQENSAEVEATEESVTPPRILGSDGQPVTEITIPAGTTQTYQLDAYPGHTFDTPCYDKDGNVATVSLSGNTLTVTGVSEGTTFFGVFDRQNHKMAVVDVTVTAAGASYLSCPDDHHPHLIDLGLPSGTKWACCNVGATTPTGYGGYYAWGETEEKTTYDPNTYIHYDGSSGTWHDLGSDIAGTQYDVAHVKWGGSWVMPSKAQQDELCENCSSEWTTVNGVNGRIFTGSNGGSIFLPAAGYRWDGDLQYAGSDGYYWLSTQHPSYSSYAYVLYFGSGRVDWSNDAHYFGQSVRPVSR